VSTGPSSGVVAGGGLVWDDDVVALEHPLTSAAMESTAKFFRSMVARAKHVACRPSYSVVSAGFAIGVNGEP
jgi:hypothetical protein